MKRENEAYYTDFEIVENLSDFFPKFLDKNDLKILEPSVGEGAYVSKIFEKYSDKNISFDAVDIDKNALKKLKKKFKNLKIINEDFLKYNFGKHYDLVIGNPPFSKAREFLEKCLTLSDYVVMILPKTFLSSEKFRRTREFLENYRVEKIVDLKENGFKNVKIETICVFINLKEKLNRKQKYFSDKKFPYWLIYRNKKFDKILGSLELGVFDVFRDRDLKNEMLSSEKSEEKSIWVLRSKNITKDGLKHIDGYDKYISKAELRGSKAIKFLKRETYILPNLSGEIRVIKKPKGVVCNGSVAMLVPKNVDRINEKHLEYFSSSEFKEFFEIATNKMSRSRNIDKNSVYFFGIKK
ncbi:Eco57I restriction-modification methylase domain-containing protein [Candidatus Saccharibacteria bacterium]|nr:Eco57I restriction-modification methylase domain-containing protein [Candidatus Saccharibacteria bacterium]